MWRFLSVVLCVSGLTLFWAGFVAAEGYHTWHLPFDDAFLVIGGAALSLLSSRLPGLRLPTAPRWSVLLWMFGLAYVAEWIYLGACVLLPKHLPAAVTAHVFERSLAIHIVAMVFLLVASMWKPANERRANMADAGA